MNIICVIAGPTPWALSAAMACLLRNINTGRPVDARFRAKTIDEDIEQPHDAPLPTGLVVQVAHADERPQQVCRADVRTYLSGDDGTLKQGANGLRQALERMSVEL